VQRAGRHLAAVLTEFASSRGMECRLLSLNDSPELHRMALAGREFVFTGCERAKGRFTVTALKAARRKAKTRPGSSSEPGTGGASDADCSTGDEEHYLHAWN